MVRIDWRHQKLSGLLRYNTFIEVTYCGRDHPPAESISSAMSERIDEKIPNLTVLRRSQQVLVIYGTISAGSPIDAISLFDEALLQALMSVGQAEEFDVARRTLAVEPVRE